MITFKAEPVIVPKDLAERIDNSSGRPDGYVRDLIAESGNLHHLDEELLSIGLMSKVKGIMEDKNIPDDCKPLSLDRLSNIVYLIMFSYCTGIMKVEDDGEVSFGERPEDTMTAMKVATSDKIKFANGKIMPTREFMNRLSAISKPESLSESYDRIVKRQGLTRRISPEAAFSVAKTSILASQKMILE